MGRRPSHTGNDKTTNPIPGGTSTTYPAEGPKESGVVGGKPLDPQKPGDSILPGKPAEPLPGIGPVFNEGAKEGVVADEAAALNSIGGNANGPALNGKAPNTVLNQKMVNDLKAGQLPGNPIGGPGTPREMPSSPNPNTMAEDFALKVLGREPTQAELVKVLTMNGGNCPGCWRAQAADGTYVTYRPAGNASRETLDTTASVDLNSPSIKALNAGKPELKLKFPGESKP